MRLQGTVGGSLYLQRDNDAFCSDVSTILGKNRKTLFEITFVTKIETILFLAMMDAQITFAGGLTRSLISFMATEGKSFMVSIKFKLPEGIVSIGKVAARPTMSAGYITYAFCTDSNPQYYYNAGQGLKAVNSW